MRAVVVGGGIIGTMPALLALDAGDEVLHIERDSRPLPASIRNFSLIWVSARAAGPDAASRRKRQSICAPMRKSSF